MTDLTAIFRLMGRIRAAYTVGDTENLAGLIAELYELVSPTTAAHILEQLQITPIPAPSAEDSSGQ